MQIGIEHEFVFKDANDNYLDFGNSKYALFAQIVDAFPYKEGDNSIFECKSLEQQPKRCYVEGFERYDINGKVIVTIPKGLEIRTLPHTTVDAVINDFLHSYIAMFNIASSYGLSPLLTSWHPHKNSVSLKAPLNHTEINLRTKDELPAALYSMLSNGIHVNISIDTYSKEQMSDLVQKVNYYAPFIIPFSFSSPFYHGGIFSGLSYRNYSRAKSHKIIQIQDRKGVDVLEFGGYDTCGDVKLLKSLLLLYKGLLLDKTLTKRASSHDVELLQLSALKGFKDEHIKKEGLIVLQAAKSALKEERKALEYLDDMLQTNDSYAVRMKQMYQGNSNIIQCISGQYSY